MGRLLLLECKVSNSATKSVKRRNRETGGKARDWNGRFGERSITGAVLAGVVELRNLKTARAGGVAIHRSKISTPWLRSWRLRPCDPPLARAHRCFGVPA